VGRDIFVALEARSAQTDRWLEQESLKKTANRAVFFEVRLGLSAVAKRRREKPVVSRHATSGNRLLLTSH
jgi:hypothetical protein